jgi:two-component system response regulator AtoC
VPARKSTESGSVAAGSRLELVVFCGERMDTYPLPASGEVTLGRAEDNSVPLSDPAVSRYHAVLRLGPGLVIEDLGGANGTWVREAEGGSDPRETLGIRRLLRDRADLAVGECVMLGTACAVVRHMPELPAEFPDPEAPNDGTALGRARVVICDPAMQAVYVEADRAARAAISVLLLGETGVGKEVLARAIHARSPRASGPFIGINCAAINEPLLESELFGYERGAFSGAQQARPGLFEAAEGGTLFLDEVAEATLTTQAKLLRVVSERTVMRLGARRARPVDVRLVAATNREPDAEIQAGRLRRDLYFRLAGVTLTIPPLRERSLDVVPLTRLFADAVCGQLERSPVTFEPEALALLAAYAWPGNVRELRNVVERAVILSGEDHIRAEHLPPSVRRGPDARSSAASPAAPLAATLSPEATPADLDASRFRADTKARDRERIREALERTSGNQTRAAELLGISRRTLVSRLRELELPRPRKRGGTP